MVFAWALNGNADAEHINSNMITIEWPPKSGKLIEIPEVDKAGWFTLEVAKEKINVGQIPLLEHLANKLRQG